MSELIPRKVQYVIGYIHILTFKDHIKKIIAPYFSYEPLEYGIDNDGTLHETFRLIFKDAGVLFQFNKEQSVFIYEGEIAELKKTNVHFEMFLDIVGKIMKIDTFTTVKFHNLSIDSVQFLNEVEYESNLITNKYLINPFKNLKEFATVLEFEEEGRNIKLQVGNFHEGDIESRKLSPLKTKFNKELYDKKGILAQLNINEEIKSPSFGKFKTLIGINDEILNRYI